MNMPRILSMAAGSFTGCGISAALFAHNYKVSVALVLVGFVLLLSAIVMFLAKDGVE